MEEYKEATKVFKESAANMKLMKRNAVTKRVRVSRGKHFSEDKRMRPSPPRQKKKPF